MQTRDDEYQERTDQSAILFAVSLVLLLISLALPILSVHTYCENRLEAVIFGVLSLITTVSFFRNRASSTRTKILSGIGVSACILAVSVNVAFVTYATHLCRGKHQCFVAELFLSTKSVAYFVCFRPLGGTPDDPNRYACEYLQFDVEEMHRMAAEGTMPFHVTVQLDSALPALLQP